MGNGEGSVYQVPAAGRRLRWVAAVVLGWDLRGRPVRSTRYASSRQAADALRREMIAAREAGRPMPDAHLTLGRYVEGWLAGRDDLAATTMGTWARALGYIDRRCGYLPLIRVGPRDIEAALSDMPPGIAPIARALMASALSDAVRDGLVTRNAAREARGVRSNRTPERIPTADELAALMAVCPDHRLGSLIEVAIGTAMREGELLGLVWEEVSGGRVRVGRQLQRIDGAPVLIDPKAGSFRTVDLPPFAVAALRRRRAEQQAERKARPQAIVLHPDGRPANLVWTTISGKPLHPNTIRAVLDALFVRAGVPRSRFHALRHAALTLITEAVGQKAAQVAAGHRSLSTTDRYSHATDELRFSCATTLRQGVPRVSLCTATALCVAA